MSIWYRKTELAAVGKSIDYVEDGGAISRDKRKDACAYFPPSIVTSPERYSRLVIHMRPLTYSTYSKEGKKKLPRKNESTK